MVIKNKLTPVAVTIAAVAGIAGGVFWLYKAPSPKCIYWQSSAGERWVGNWLAYASCPLLYFDFNRSSIVIVPFINGVIYGLLVYLALRKRPVISAGIILGYAAAVFWEIAYFTGMSIANWMLNWNCWLIYASFPLVGFIDTSKLNEGFQPLLNAIYVLMVIFVIRRFAKRPAVIVLPILGYVVGMFCAIAVNDGRHGMNVREWFPNWINWLVYVICPFVDIVRPLGIANGLVPLLNAFYGYFLYTLFTRINHRLRVSVHSPTY